MVKIAGFIFITLFLLMIAVVAYTSFVDIPAPQNSINYELPTPTPEIRF